MSKFHAINSAAMAFALGLNLGTGKPLDGYATAWCCGAIVWLGCGLLWAIVDACR